eukprot:CAMPEP_0116938128 /NCGR_PEP_ID=MMETSP0467-20121206/31926_1 /TAXON_ID=283647 /ORGANISM="Mesodinium pulex, Strain SPMC105" /LENGTH=66 /DNA_ID=CAMNT_0004620097 /DNA_START=1223 /DNA_END=1423 /DNA_ORIENTATION=+
MHNLFGSFYKEANADKEKEAKEAKEGEECKLFRMDFGMVQDTTEHSIMLKIKRFFNVERPSQQGFA